MTAHVAPPAGHVDFSDQQVGQENRHDDELERLCQLAGRRPAVDLLAEAIERVRRDLLEAPTLIRRVMVFSAGIMTARELGATDVVHDEFVLLAIDSGLFDEFAARPPYDAAETIEHLIRWNFVREIP